MAVVGVLGGTFSAVVVALVPAALVVLSLLRGLGAGAAGTSFSVYDDEVVVVDATGRRAATEGGACIRLSKRRRPPPNNAAETGLNASLGDLVASVLAARLALLAPGPDPDARRFPPRPIGRWLTTASSASASPPHASPSSSNGLSGSPSRPLSSRSRAILFTVDIPCAGS